MIRVPHIGPLVQVAWVSLSDPYEVNRYATTGWASNYFRNHKLNTEAWDEATSEQQRKALTEATDIVDRLNYSGIKTSEDQPLEFPRGGDLEVPTDIASACCEVAYALLDGVDPEIEYENLSMTSQVFGNTKASYDTGSWPENFSNGVPSFKAWTYLKPYFASARNINIVRIS